MKVVKLRKNQALYKKGFTHGFRFDSSWDDEASSVLRALNKIFNNRQWRGHYNAWDIQDGRWITDGTGRWVLPFTIGVRNESVITQVLLIKDTLE